ncbi:hypothetical protein [Lactiplantibacillus daowaiensis]|uniref:Uncharacterized protein n=1 Tax=Lactiplantibacillus daowaiensis TaxID=2559918 RepID=A0ABW1S485_9LACO|nr:hypothetical protein [Lactiplantibacillus daowaiensis]
MQLIRPIIFYKTMRFWVELLFVWVVFAGYPRIYATAGDVIAYGLILILSLATIFSTIIKRVKH